MIALMAWYATPYLFPDFRAIALLEKSAAAPSIKDAFEYAKTANRIAENAKLKMIAGIFKDSWSIALESGAETKDQVEGFEGMIRGFISGFYNPIYGAKCGVVLAKWSFCNFYDYPEEINQELWLKTCTYRFIRYGGVCIAFFVVVFWIVKPFTRSRTERR